MTVVVVVNARWCTLVAVAVRHVDMVRVPFVVPGLLWFLFSCHLR